MIKRSPLVLLFFAFSIMYNYAKADTSNITKPDSAFVLKIDSISEIIDTTRFSFNTYPIIIFPSLNDSGHFFSRQSLSYIKYPHKSDSQFYVFMVFIFLVVFVFRSNTLYFINLSKSALNFRLAKQYFRSEGQSESQINILLIITFLVTFGFLIGKISNPFSNVLLPQFNWVMPIILVFGFYLFKISMYFILGQLFNILNALKFYMFNISLYVKITGLILLPLLFLVQYSPLESTIILALFWVLTLFTFLKTLQRGYLISRESAIGNSFHFLLYFCGIELIPFLVCIKLIFNVAGTSSA